MLKSFITLAAVMVFLFSFNAARADFEVHIVDSLGENVNFRDGDTFQLSETPYLYFNVPDFNPAWQYITFTGSYWQDPENALTATLPVSPNSDGDVWVTLDWDSISKTAGLWNVSGWYAAPSGAVGSDSTTFSYAAVPEPVAMVLFITGGSVLMARRMRRGRK